MCLPNLEHYHSSLVWGLDPDQACSGSRASSGIQTGWSTTPSHHLAHKNIHTFKLQIYQQSYFSGVVANPEGNISTRDSNLSSGSNQGAVRQKLPPVVPKAGTYFPKCTSDRLLNSFLLWEEPSCITPVAQKKKKSMDLQDEQSIWELIALSASMNAFPEWLPTANPADRLLMQYIHQPNNQLQLKQIYSTVIKGINIPTNTSSKISLS